MHKFIIMFALVALGACGVTPSARDAAVTEVAARDLVFPSYPQAGNTYLSFSQAHGFQVNYLDADGRAWLWYPGNRVGLPERWRVDLARDAVCWRHPSQSYNPVTKRYGGQEQCMALALARRTIVSTLPGDPYDLRSGNIPYARQKCIAPKAFSFDRNRFRC